MIPSRFAPPSAPRTRLPVVLPVLLVLAGCVRAGTARPVPTPAPPPGAPGRNAGSPDTVVSPEEREQLRQVTREARRMARERTAPDSTTRRLRADSALPTAFADGAARDGFRGAALALFDFYAAHPQELALGFYLGGGGLAPRGLGQGLDPGLNAALVAALAPMRALGGQEAATEAFALAVGLLVMSETRRIRLFGLSARALMESHLARLPQRLG